MRKRTICVSENLVQFQAAGSQCRSITITVLRAVPALLVAQTRSTEETRRRTYVGLCKQTVIIRDSRASLTSSSSI